MTLLLEPEVALSTTFDANLNECSHCYLTRIRKVAADNRKRITANPARRFNRRHCKGIDVRVNGRFVHWINSIPERCECE